MPSDARLRSFLDALEESDTVEVDDWEAEFIESTLDQEHFTENQRAAILRMIDDYGHRVRDW